VRLARLILTKVILVEGALRVGVIVRARVAVQAQSEQVPKVQRRCRVQIAPRGFGVVGPARFHIVNSLDCTYKTLHKIGILSCMLMVHNVVSRDGSRRKKRKQERGEPINEIECRECVGNR
jgi:hypothetical protein